MASHDDLDLIRLFGLSAEEASGLGLAPSAQPPGPEPAERRSAARPAPVAPRRPGAHAEPVAPEGAPGIVVPESVTRPGPSARLDSGDVTPESSRRAAPGARPVAEGHASPRLVGEAHASPAGTERTGSAPLRSPHGSTATAGAQGADREADRTTRDSELALLAMFGNPAPAHAPDDSGRGATRGLALADAVTPPGSKVLGSGGGKAEVDMLPPPGVAPAEGQGRASGANEVPRPQGAEAPDRGDAERFIWPADRLAEEDNTVDVVSLFDLTAEEATSLGLTLHAAPAEGQGRASGASAVPRPQGAEAPGASAHAWGVPARETPASTLRTMHLRAIDQDWGDELATSTPPQPPVEGLLGFARSTPPGVRAISAGGAGDGASGHGASGASPATPGAPADDEGLKDMLVNVSAASGTVKDNVQPADVDRPSVDSPAQRAEVDTTPEAAVPVSSQLEATAGDTLESRSLRDSPARVTPGDASATAPELGVDPALLDAFAEESAELLDSLHVELEQLESDVDDHGALLETRRIIHTIKGGAKMCGFELVALLTHSSENLLDLIADGVAPLDGQNLRALFECEPLLRAAVQDALTGGGANLDGVATLAARFDAYCLARGPREAALEGYPRSGSGVSPATAASDDLSPASDTDVPPAGSVRNGSLPAGDSSAAPSLKAGADDLARPSGRVADVADTAAEGPATATAMSEARAAQAVPPETATVGADAIRPSSSANGAGEGSAGATASTPPVSGDPARPRWQGTHDVGSPRSGGDPERPRWPSGERGRGREAQRGGRNANSINVDLSKVDAVVAKVTELAAHRVSSQGMIGQLLATSEDARRNVARLHSVAMQLSNECTSILPEGAQRKHDDLDLERYTTRNTLVLQLQEAVSDQQALVQALHDTITSHWSLQASESRVDADIQNALMNIRLVPLGNLRVRLDGVVRQAAEATGKLVRWQLQGGSVAVEKNVFDRLFEPLMHLL
ncbi:MAG TPA: Hpt domain-containing protein, partial [Chloroflexota bacterium]|nr:Hpt domain-containing protein [Chloroflexota bacterium]